MKRIVICADGTWNVRDQLDERTGKRRPTNVTKVARSILPTAADGTPQLVFYLEGVGTDGGMDKYTGGAFGSGIEDNVRTLYRAVVYNYEPGDHLFLFGFSRGAFTVRTLAGFLHYAGLVHKDDDYYLPEIYAAYEKGHARGSEGWTRAFHGVRRAHEPPPIKFVGVWDTVGALGAPGFLGQLFNKNKYQYHDVGLHDDIENAYQALAIDERRKPFAPSVWKRPPGWKGDLVQAWFAGVHCNVGGGLTPDGLANEALHWMVEKAESHGLEFNRDFIAAYRPCYNAMRHESMTNTYRALGEHLRPICADPASGEVLHRSAHQRWFDTSCGYTPANLRAHLAAHGETVPTVDTTRVPRGTPCPPL